MLDSLLLNGSISAHLTALRDVFFLDEKSPAHPPALWELMRDLFLFRHWLGTVRVGHFWPGHVQVHFDGHGSGPSGGWHWSPRAEWGILMLACWSAVTKQKSDENSHDEEAADEAENNHDGDGSSVDFVDVDSKGTVAGSGRSGLCDGGAARP